MKKTPRLQISSTLRGERFRKKLRRYFACEIATSELHMVRRPSDCSNVHHGHQEKPCGRGGHALRARNHRGKEKAMVVVLGSRAITSSKQCRAVHSCTSAMPTRLCTRGRDKRVTEQCATLLLLYLRTTTAVVHQRVMVDNSVANEKQIIVRFELNIFHFPLFLDGHVCKLCARYLIHKGCVILTLSLLSVCCWLLLTFSTSLLLTLSSSVPSLLSCLSTVYHHRLYDFSYLYICSDVAKLLDCACFFPSPFTTITVEIWFYCCSSNSTAVLVVYCSLFVLRAKDGRADFCFYYSCLFICFCIVHSVLLEAVILSNIDWLGLYTLRVGARLCFWEECGRRQMLSFAWYHTLFVFFFARQSTEQKCS